jgi:hypothetical protein
MKNRITMTVVLVLGLFVFSGCALILGIVGQLQETREEGWSTKQVLDELMNHSEKELLTKNEKSRALKGICELKHLDEYKNRGNYKEKALAFCKIEQDSQIYFLKEITRQTGMVVTVYLEVLENKPIKYIKIERKYSKKLGRTIPIIERLH